jgi:hypothetical protein
VSWSKLSKSAANIISLDLHESLPPLLLALPFLVHVTTKGAQQKVALKPSPAAATAATAFPLLLPLLLPLLPLPLPPLPPLSLAAAAAVAAAAAQTVEKP